MNSTTQTETGLELFPDYTKHVITVGTFQRHSNLVLEYATVEGTDPMAFQIARALAADPESITREECLMVLSAWEKATVNRLTPKHHRQLTAILKGL